MMTPNRITRIKPDITGLSGARQADGDRMDRIMPFRAYPLSDPPGSPAPCSQEPVVNVLSQDPGGMWQPNGLPRCRVMALECQSCRNAA